MVMKYVKVINDLNINIEKLRNAYENCTKNFVTDNPNLKDFNCICINRKPNDPNSITGGDVRGLYWTYPNETKNEEKRLEKVDEASYNEICPEFKSTYIEEVYNKITKKFKLGRVRFLMKPPRSCLSWHRDPEMRLHIPIITNIGCRMIIEEESYHLPADGNAYITDNTKYHNFFNGSEINRVHLVATILENRHIKAA